MIFKNSKLFGLLIELSYWFIACFCQKIIGILTTQYAKDNCSYCSKCSVKSSLRDTWDEIEPPKSLFTPWYIHFFFRVRFSFKEGSCDVSFCCLWYAWIQNSRKHLSSVINVDLTLATSSQCRIQDFLEERQSSIWPIPPPPPELHKNEKKNVHVHMGTELVLGLWRKHSLS